MSTKHSFMAAAIAAGAVIGAGLYLCHALIQRNKEKHLQQHIAKLHLSLLEAQQELIELRNSKSSSNSMHSLKSNRTKSSLSNSKSGHETDDDMFSALNTDDDEEFYDLNSEDEDMLLKPLNESSINKEEDKLFEEIDSLLKGNDEDRLKAFNLLKKNELELSENSDFLWRFAQAHQIQATASGALNDLVAKKKYVLEGLEYASKALALDLSNPDAHKWFAILIGMQGDFVSIKERIQNGYLFQKHVLIALECKPEDYSLHYLLGRFKFEVANTSWVEKKIASTIFAEVPSLTFADAIADLHRAEKLNPTPWKENRLLLARCYIGDGKYDKAVEWLDAAKKITPRTKDDEACDREIYNLIEKYKKYRK